MRKTSVVLLSAATGAALTLFVTQPRSVLMGSSARAATSDTYRQLNLFGDVFERVRSDYVEKPDDSKLVESAISGMLTGPRSAFELHGRQELPRHAGADPRRIRRPRHRSHDGRRPDQGGLADRRHAGVQGRHHGQRHHHQSRRRSRAGPHPQPGRREDARPGQHQDQAQDHPQGPGQSDRRHAGARQYPRPLGARACRSRRYRLYPHHHLQRTDHRRPEAGNRQPVRPRSATS